MVFHADFLRVLVFVMLLHTLWDTGLLWNKPDNAGFLRIDIYLWLTIFVGSWYLLLLLVREGLRQIEEAKTVSCLYGDE